MVIYGKLRSEQVAEEKLKCREIAREIVQSQVTDRQLWLIMYNLAIELENVEDMKMATDFIKEYKGHELFLSLQNEE